MIKRKKEGKVIKVEISDAIGLRNSVSFDAILIRSPLRFLNDAIRAKRFLEGVIVSVMYFERFGIDKLKEYFKSKGIPIEPMNIENLHLSTILRMLEGFGVISHRTHSLMGQVCAERNKIVHELKHPDAIDESKAKTAIETTIECLKVLGVK